VRAFRSISLALIAAALVPCASVGGMDGEPTNCPTRSEVATLVDRYLAILSAGGPHTDPSFYADDIDFWDPTVNLRGRGKAETQRWADRFGDYSEFKLLPRSVVIDCNTAVVEGEMTALYHGAPISSDFLTVLTFRDGQVAVQRDFYNDVALLQQVLTIDAPASRGVS
jgi:ketosteroid isomerase-like protein